MNKLKSDVVFRRSRPNVTADLAERMLKHIFGVTAIGIEEFKSHEDRNFYVQADVNRNQSKEFVFKILLCEEEDLIRPDLELAVQSMMKLHEAGFVVPQPVNGLTDAYIYNHTLGAGNFYPFKLGRSSFKYM